MKHEKGDRTSGAFPPMDECIKGIVTIQFRVSENLLAQVGRRELWRTACKSQPDWVWGRSDGPLPGVSSFHQSPCQLYTLARVLPLPPFSNSGRLSGSWTHRKLTHPWGLPESVLWQWKDMLPDRSTLPGEHTLELRGHNFMLGTWTHQMQVFNAT